MQVGFDASDQLRQARMTSLMLCSNTCLLKDYFLFSIYIKNTTTRIFIWTRINFPKTMIPKPGKHTVIPFKLLSDCTDNVIRKITEWMIYAGLMDKLHQKWILSTLQCRRRAKRTTTEVFSVSWSYSDWSSSKQSTCLFCLFLNGKKNMA